jgi:predicted CopG family antitoxin
MSPTIEVSDETVQELESHCEPEESYDDLIQELLHLYEQQGTFLREGYSE